MLIDEIPIIALAAVYAEGETKIIDAEELRYKESDRISLTVNWMKKAGAVVEELRDGIIITGNNNQRSHYIWRNRAWFVLEKIY